jgi:catechol 2,3-dioxygenase-like lactoylglutathione lyase family enzyme
MMKDTASMAGKPRLVGINHVALEVGDIDAALAFWGAIFSFELRGRSENGAFIDMGDQFVARMRTDASDRDAHRHFGLVVDDRSRVRALASAAGAEMIEGGFLDFRDPWGNFIQVVEYRDLQFSKTDAVLRGMGLHALDKTKEARAELAKKGML